MRTASFSPSASAPQPQQMLYMSASHATCGQGVKRLFIPPPAPLKLSFPSDLKMLLEVVGGLTEGNSIQQRSQTAPRSTCCGLAYLLHLLWQVLDTWRRKQRQVAWQYLSPFLGISLALIIHRCSFTRNNYNRAGVQSCRWRFNHSIV